MKRIGRGYYYTVYDLGNGRVRKVETDPVTRALHILQAEVLPWRWIRALWRTYADRNAVRTSYERLRAQCEPSLLGNPVLLSGINYEQDKVRMLHEAIDAGGDDARRALDAYAACVHDTWRNGFADRIFNFSINCGMKDDRSILIDFNEVTFEKAEVKEQISSKRWLRAYAYQALPKDLKPYYRALMEKALTYEALDRLWGSRGGGGG